MATGYKINPPPQNVPIFDPVTGTMNQQWLIWFQKLWELVR